jgi:peptidyl-prolyl cis-trans isomerase B (cyclophilin B)
MGEARLLAQQKPSRNMPNIMLTQINFKYWRNALFLVLALALVVSCAQQKEKEKEEEVAVITTTEGVMVVQFWTNAASNTIANFKKLAKSGFFDGTCFHRVIRGFMIQGGDPLTKDPAKEAMWGTGDPGYKINAEFNDHSHVRGVLSMARSSDPNSAGSQFFICHGNPTQLDHQYTTFGKLIKGDDVLEKIATTPTHPPDRPDKRMEIISIKIVPASSAT